MLLPIFFFVARIFPFFGQLLVYYTNTMKTHKKVNFCSAFLYSIHLFLPASRAHSRRVYISKLKLIIIVILHFALERSKNCKIHSQKWNYTTCSLQNVIAMENYFCKSKIPYLQFYQHWTSHLRIYEK